MMGLNTAFKKVYGEALASYGFQKVKGRHPYLVKVINEDVVHVIGIQNDFSMRQWYSKFEIYYGVATIYRDNLDLAQPIRDCKDWFLDLSHIYGGIHKEKLDEALWDRFNSFYYKKEDDSLEEELSVSFELFMDYIFPMLSNITTIEECVNYLGEFCPISLHLQDKEWDEMGNTNPNCRDGLANILVYDAEEYEKVTYESIDKVIDLFYKDMLNGKNGFTETSLREFKDDLLEAAKRNVQLYNSVVNDENKCKSAREVMAQRKIKNLAMLKKRGISV